MSRIFIDMDGVLAKWENATLEEMTSPGFFASRKPVANVINAVRRLQDNPEFEVFILSSYLLDISKEEKITWNALHTQIPEDHQIYVPYGEKKGLALQKIGGIQPDDVLLDDFSQNLHEWEGIGVKLYNGINGTHGTWAGFSVHSNMTPEHMVMQLTAVAKEGREQLRNQQLSNNKETAEPEKTRYQPRGR